MVHIFTTAHRICPIGPQNLLIRSVNVGCASLVLRIPKQTKLLLRMLFQQKIFVGNSGRGVTVGLPPL
jgi:hypothetical protein